MTASRRAMRTTLIGCAVLCALGLAAMPPAAAAAGEVAAALGAESLVFLTDVAGVLDTSKRLLTKLNAAEVRALIASGVAAGGMVPTLAAAARAASAGCATRIVDGTAEGALASVLRGDDVGTTITG